MPTLLLYKGLRFFFYSNENREPAHVHVAKGSANGKIWLEPWVEEQYLIGFTRSEEMDIRYVLEVNAEAFKQQWYAYFRK